MTNDQKSIEKHLNNFNEFVRPAFEDNTFAFQAQVAADAAFGKHKHVVEMPNGLRKFVQVTVAFAQVAQREEAQVSRFAVSCENVKLKLE